MTVEGVEKRWCLLRDMFSRKSRRQKLLPSSSGTKASLQSASQNILSGISTERNEFSSFSDHFSTTNSPLFFIDHSYVGNVDSVEEKEVIIPSVDHDTIGTPISTISSSNSSICQQFSTSSRNTNSRFSNSPRIFKQHEKVTREVDRFVKLRKCRDDLLQQDLEKTYSSISNVLKSMENVMFDQKSCSRDGYMLALEDGLKHVPEINKTQCLIEVRQVIQKYEERQS